MTISKKKLKQAKKLYPQKSIRQIAKELGVDEKELAKELKEEEPASSSFPKAKINIVSLIVLVATTFIIYSNSFHNTFHYDDYHSLTKNIHIRKLSNIPKFFADPQTFSSKPGVKMVRPLLLTSFALNYAWTQYNPWSWILVNLIIHLANVILLYLLLVHFTGKEKFALVASLIFALHPVNTESVNYINCRSTLFETTFMIFSVYAFLRGLVNKKWLWLALGYISFGLGQLVKEEAIVIIAIVFIIDLLFIKGEKKWQERIFYYLPFLFVIVIYFIYRQAVMDVLLTQNKPRPFFINIRTQSRSLVHYLNLLLYPIHLNISYELIVRYRWIKDWVLLAMLYLAVLLGVGIYLWRKLPSYTFFILSFFIFLAPTTLIPLNAIMNEHRVYLPSISFGILFADIIFRLMKKLPSTKRKILPNLLLIIFTCYALLVVVRNRVYVSDMRLWRDTIRKSPTKAQVISDLGNAYFRLIPPNLDRAEQLYKWAIKYDPRYFKAYHNLAIVNYRRADQIRDQDPERAKELFKIAVKYFKQALNIFPFNPDSWNDLGTTYIQLKEYENAEVCYRKAIRLDPLDYKAYFNLGYLMEIQKKYPEAEEAYKAAVRIYDQDPKHWYRLIQAQFKQKKYNEVLKTIEQALRLFPNNRSLKNAYEQVYAIVNELKATP